MERRDFLTGLIATPALAAVGCAGAALEGSNPTGAVPMSPDAPEGARASHEALRDLIDALSALESSWVQAPARGHDPYGFSDGYRNLMHSLEDGLLRAFEADPEWPVFQRMVTPTRKYLGDNPDAIYFSAFVRGGRRYRIRGNLAGAVYTSFTLEYGDEGSTISKGVASVLNDSEFEVETDGSYEILLSPTEEPGHRGWLELPPNAMQITTRHYFERERSAAADPSVEIPLVIEPLDAPAPPPTFDDARVAAGMRRVIEQLNWKAAMAPPPGERPMPAWVGTTPNIFPTPSAPGDIAYTALDASYTMAPYSLGPDEALVMTGRFPKCRFANVVLWNAHNMTYDYAHRPTSRNRKQTKLEADGSFRMVLAHRDPGVPNWIDTEGRPSGMVFWRFFLPDEQPVTPRAEVVPFDAVRAR
ncbi:MAG: DUF1214 domain-containing protein [Spirochaetaceae bacterium]|nr:DUF1214 domain-containing protein [Myxococcales bacterium]MCB9724783.1 DUF1214 domain-containing protein [Spirochaetaceae bacterium]HPG28665.1 DUF1214 domain-containing protein [Myxococcota bacterium]